MKKIYHKTLHDEFIPKLLTDPVFVTAYHCSLSEMEQIVAWCLKTLRPFQGEYELAVNFTEPNTDPRFKIGHVGCVISVWAETEDLAKEMEAKFCESVR